MRNPLNHLSVAFSIALFVMGSPAFSQISTEDMAKAIPFTSLQHPYLFFTDGEKPAIRSRIQNDPECRKAMDGLLAEGFRYVRMPFESTPMLESIHPRFDREGNKGRQYISEVVEGMITCAFLYQMTGEQAYAKRGTEFALALCDVPDWVGGAHRFDIIYPRVWPRNVPDDQVVFSFDISAAGRASSLATAYDWLYQAMTKEQRDKIRGALLEKAITRVRGNYEFFWWSTAHRCNWSAICFSGLGVTALALLNEHPQLTDVVAESYNRISRTFDEIDEDGGWQEGRGYYHYMLHESIEFMDALKRITRGQFDLFRHKKLAAHPLDFILYAQTANFGDSEGIPTEAPSMVNKLVQETRNGEGAWYRKTFLREAATVFDIIWPTTDVVPVEPKFRSRHFRGIDWAILGTDFRDPAAMTIACKAGMNDDPHHGHLDCGEFIMTWNGVPFIRDIGKMEYDEFYFNEDRFSYPYGSTLGHNVITVNGEVQSIAKKKNSPWKEGVGGKIVEFTTGKARDYVCIDATKAYPGKEVKKWRRSIVLEKPSVALVLDEIGSHVGANIRSRFFPGTSEAMKEHPSRRTTTETDHASHTLISIGGQSLAMIPLVLEGSYKLVQGEIPFLPVTKNARLEWIPFLEMQTIARTAITVMATVFVPVPDSIAVQSIVRSISFAAKKSGEIEVHATIAGKNMSWLFERKNDAYFFKQQ